MFLQQLHNILLSINREKKSGKVYVYVKEGPSKRSGIISVGEGEILSISYAQDKNASALEKMLSLEVKEVVFMPLSDSSDKEPDAPSIEGILEILQSLSGDVVNTVDPREIREGVEALLKIIYGPGIVKEIDKIAKSNPIDQNPKKFLDQCKAKAMLMLSKDQVETLFKPLYAKINQ